MGYLFWLILTIIFTVIEFIIPALVTVWFAFAAVITIFVSLAFDNLKVEITFFAAISVLAIIFLRPFAKKLPTGLRPWECLLRQRPSTCAGPISPIRRSVHWFPAYIAAPIANQKTMKTTIPTTCQKKSARAQFFFALERLPPKARTSR